VGSGVVVCLLPRWRDGVWVRKGCMLAAAVVVSAAAVLAAAAAAAAAAGKGGECVGGKGGVCVGVGRVEGVGWWVVGGGGVGGGAVLGFGFRLGGLESPVVPCRGLLLPGLPLLLLEGVARVGCGSGLRRRRRGRQTGGRLCRPPPLPAFAQMERCA
jgi:hypothetical protein